MSVTERNPNNKENNFNFQTLTESSVYEQQLIEEGISLEGDISSRIEEVKYIKTTFFVAKNGTEKALRHYIFYANQTRYYRQRVREYQKYGVSVNGIATSDAISTLSDIIEQLENKLYMYFGLINTKKNEISSARLTAANILLSIIASIIAVIYIM